MPATALLCLLAVIRVWGCCKCWSSQGWGLVPIDVGQFFFLFQVRVRFKGFVRKRTPDVGPALCLEFGARFRVWFRLRLRSLGIKFGVRVLIYGL